MNKLVVALNTAVIVSSALIIVIVFSGLVIRNIVDIVKSKTRRKL